MPTAFIDRDGTINDDIGYLSDPDKLLLLPNAVSGLRLLSSIGFDLVVVTNQSGIARGLHSEDAVIAVNERLRKMLGYQGVTLADIRYCPHYVSGTVPKYRIECNCRKPKTGMLMPINPCTEPHECVMIGDKATDVQAGKNAGFSTILVRTGEGRYTESNCPNLFPDYIADDLLDAASFMQKRRQSALKMTACPLTGGLGNNKS